MHLHQRAIAVRLAAPAPTLWAARSRSRLIVLSATENASKKMGSPPVAT